VSTPLTWQEVADGVDPRDFTIRTALARFAEVGDLWKPLRAGKPVDLGRVLSKAAVSHGDSETRKHGNLT
jgi:DNA primase